MKLRKVFLYPNELSKSAFVTPLKASAISVIKKDGTREHFDNSKIINAVKNQLLEHWLVLQMKN